MALCVTANFGANVCFGSKAASNQCPLCPQKRTLGLTAQGLLQLASDLRMAIMELERYRLRVSRAGQDGDSAAKK